MAWLHRICCIAHRDLKPGNLLVQSRDSLRIKVADFGFSQVVAAAAAGGPGGFRDAGGQTKCSPLYTAPEVLRSAELSLAIDVYSFGIILFEIFAEKRAFSEDPWSSTIEAILREIAANGKRPCYNGDAALKTLMESCWTADPGARPSFTSVADTLESLLLETLLEDDHAARFWKAKFCNPALREEVPWLEFAKEAASDFDLLQSELTSVRDELCAPSESTVRIKGIRHFCRWHGPFTAETIACVLSEKKSSAEQGRFSAIVDEVVDGTCKLLGFRETRESERPKALKLPVSAIATAGLPLLPHDIVDLNTAMRRGTVRSFCSAHRASEFESLVEHLAALDLRAVREVRACPAALNAALMNSGISDSTAEVLLNFLRIALAGEATLALQQCAVSALALAVSRQQCAFLCRSPAWIAEHRTELENLAIVLAKTPPRGFSARCCEPLLLALTNSASAKHQFMLRLFISSHRWEKSDPISTLDWMHTAGIFPTAEELVGPHAIHRTLRHLWTSPARVEEGHATSPREYLERLYRLYRADCFLPVSEGLCAISTGNRGAGFCCKEVSVFRTSVVYPISCRSFLLLCKPVSVHPGTLVHGGVVAISLDGIGLERVVWATVDAQREQAAPSDTAEVRLPIRFAESVNLVDVQRLLVGCPRAIVVAAQPWLALYKPVLHAIASLARTRSIPFEDEFVRGISREAGDCKAVRAVCSQHSHQFASLDESQQAALMDFESRRLSLVVGPPGLVVSSPSASSSILTLSQAPASRSTDRTSPLLSSLLEAKAMGQSFWCLSRTFRQTTFCFRYRARFSTATRCKAHSFDSCALAKARK